MAAVLSIGQRLLTLAQTVEAWFTGIKTVLYVLIILTLAWALSAVAGDLGAAEYLAGTLGEAIPATRLPALLFVIAAAVAFATGTSWGTMGILTPLAVPLAWAVLEAGGMADPAGHPILFASVATILGGAVWGATARGVPWWVVFPVAAVILVAGLRLLGKPVSATEAEPVDTAVR